LVDFVGVTGVTGVTSRISILLFTSVPCLDGGFWAESSVP
jgi:hypothetical protein